MIDDDGTIRHQVRFDHPIDRVWRALTDREEIAKWLMANDFAPVVGHVFRMDARPSHGWIQAEVLTVEPPHLLRCRWNIDGAATTVTMTLRTDGDGTVLYLEHAGLTDDPRPGFDTGWIEKFDNITSLLKDAP